MRTFPAFALALLALQYVGIPLHFAVESHSLCLEHGELTHGDPHGKSDGTTGRGTHSHEHCLLADARRDDGALAPDLAACALDTPSLAGDGPAARLDRPASPREPTYRLAPKNSPPALPC